MPNIVLMSLSWPVNLFEIVQYFLPFPVALFLTGFLLAPVIGPKVVNSKGWSFIMSFICMFVALFAYIVGMSAPDFEDFKFGFLIITFMAMLGIFPALMGGLFYIGACEHASEIT